MDTLPLAYTFTRYLSAKKSVDDRALNRLVWNALLAAVNSRLSTTAGAYSVLEIGSGIGTMIERTLDWRLFAGQHSRVQYTAVDADADNTGVARARLAEVPTPLNVDFRTQDVFTFADQPAHYHTYDLLIAHAFLDLVDIQLALPILKQLVRPNALFYFTINFDGATILQPEIDPAFDQAVEAAYHRTMDERIVGGAQSGDSHSGRHLFGHLKHNGFAIQAAGSSDWVVHASNGRYAADEAYFLHFIINTMYGALAANPALDPDRFAAWIAERHAQIDRGELVYIAHQLDFCGAIE
jgi:SAM-dependent methyltransferase